MKCWQGFRYQFIEDVDANTVVWELLHKNIIPRGVHERILRTDEHEHQNENPTRLSAENVHQRGLDGSLWHI